MAAIELHFPPELILAICGFVYSSGLPAVTPSLDPIIINNENGTPAVLPSSQGNWSESVARTTLANLCLVNRAWRGGAKPWLWRRVEVKLPRNWQNIVDGILGDSDDEPTTVPTAMSVGVSIKAAAEAVLASRAISGGPHYRHTVHEHGEQIVEQSCAQGSPVHAELPPTPASRDPCPSRQCVQVSKTIDNDLRKVTHDNEQGFYYSPPHDPRSGRYVRQLDFNHFRTIGMFRSVEEVNNNRLVTGDRIEAVLKELINLTAFGATEYMDRVLTHTVLEELFLRGRPSRKSRDAYSDDSAEEDRARRGRCRDLEAVDLTGCVSAPFVNALTQFVTTHLRPSQSLEIPGLQRLGLRGVKSVPSHILMPFVLAFPSLTHLDLSCTRTTPELLAALGTSANVRLHSLSLARCVSLTADSIRDFLVCSPVASHIQELSLYGDMSYSSPLSEDDLHEIFTSAPCFTSGNLVYLDISSARITRELLIDVCKPQKKLRSLGLSYIPDLGLDSITEFLLSKAPNVEVLTLVSTSPELDCGFRAGVLPAAARGLARQASLALHSQLITPLCTSPLSFKIDLTAPVKQPPTRLRVIELGAPLLSGIGAGACEWRVLRSKGGRGWYVDTTSGWVMDGKDGSRVLKRDLDESHALRQALDMLADANGNVGNGIGWHSRKMEILRGHGMLGREEGLYGAVSFAHQG